MSEPFQPQPIDLPDIPTADISWDVRLLADDLGWTWDDELGRYLDSNKQPVTEQEILDAVTAELADWEAIVNEATEALLNEDAPVDSWEERMAEIVTAIAAIFFLFGLGDKAKLTDEHTEAINERLTVQFEYLRAFSEAILAGTLTAAMIGARALLYAHDAESNHGYGQDAAHDADRWPYYSNVLGTAERHCPECPALTARGIVERGSLPPIGTRQCSVRCKCHFAYYQTADGRQRNSIIRHGWLGQDSIVSNILIPVTYG